MLIIKMVEKPVFFWKSKSIRLDLLRSISFILPNKFFSVLCFFFILIFGKLNRRLNQTIEKKKIKKIMLC